MTNDEFNELMKRYGGKDKFTAEAQNWANNLAVHAEDAPLSTIVVGLAMLLDAQIGNAAPELREHARELAIKYITYDRDHPTEGNA